MKKLSIILFSLVLISTLVSGATLTLQTNGAGSSTQWTNSGSSMGSANYVSVQSNDGDTSYVQATQPGYIDFYALANHTTQSGTINSVTVSIVSKFVTSYMVLPVFIGIKQGSSIAWDSGRNPSSSSYSTYQSTWATKPSGGAWTWADVDSLEAGIKFGTTSSGPPDPVTQLLVTVDYTPTATAASCTLSPATASVQVNATQSFTATCKDSGSSIVACPALSWTTDSGTMNSSGVLTAQSTPKTGGSVAANSTTPAFSCSSAVTVTAAPVVVNGACGTANSHVFSSTDSFPGTFTFCSAGTANPATPSDPPAGGSTSWNCVGSGTGHTDSPTCTASRASAPVVVNGSCGVTNNSCTAGSSSDVADSPTQYLWDCIGSGGGTTANCSLLKPVADSTPPSIPTGISGSANSTTISLTWIASTDNVAVAGYKIFRNGTQVGTSSSASFGDSGLSPSTSYSYTVSAFDASGNNSGVSTAFSKSTTAAVISTIPEFELSSVSVIPAMPGKANPLTVSVSVFNSSSSSFSNDASLVVKIKDSTITSTQTISSGSISGGGTKTFNFSNIVSGTQWDSFTEGKVYTVAASVEYSGSIIDLKEQTFVLKKESTPSVPEASPLLVVLALAGVLGIVFFKNRAEVKN